MTGYIMCFVEETETYLYPYPIVSEGIFNNYEKLIQRLIQLNSNQFDKFFPNWFAVENCTTKRQFIETYCINPETDSEGIIEEYYINQGFYIAYSLKHND